VTSDERGLLDAIRDDPYDDALRLVYADWLEENGRADHAELIRVQIALEQEQRNWKALERREGKLIEKLKATWPAALADAGVSYRRGLGVAEWAGFADFAEGPRRLRSAGSPAWVVERELTIDGSGWRDDHFKKLTQSPDFALLTGFEIERGEALTDATPAAIGETGAAALASSPYLGRLRRLGIWCRIGPQGVARLVNSKKLAELHELVLLGCADDRASMVALSEATGLPRLRSLCLTSNNVGDARLRLLLKSPLLCHLEELIIAGNKIRDGGAKALAECESLKGLKSLCLNGNQIGEEGAKALLESPCLMALEELDAQWQKISEATRSKLRKRFKKRKAR
jgi:uncharacterized protein (TIGR02996 family)